MSERSSKDHSAIHVELPRRALQLTADKLPPGAVVLLVAPEQLAPEFFPMPDGRGRCPITGMSRTWVQEQITRSQGTQHPIKSHHLRQRGSTRGVILIDRASYVAWVESHDAPEWADDGDSETQRRKDTEESS